MKLLVYESWRLDYPQVVYSYRWDGGVERVTLGLGEIPQAALAAAPADGLANLLAHAGVAFARYLAPLDDFDQLHVEPLALPPPAVRYFERTFERGLAEMRYRNGLAVRKPFQVTASPDAPRYAPAPLHPAAGADQALLLNGGGKDSAVAGEILKAIGLPFTWLTVQSPRAAAMAGVVDASANPRAIHLEHRPADPALTVRFRYRDVLAPRLGFIALIPAYVHGMRYVVTANEHSANFGNLVVDGVAINHQAGKSLAAETAFARYVERYLVPGLRYFSLLAPLYEIQIARLFAACPQYFGRFLSCNVGWREERWCGECPKCAFVYLILAAFLPPEPLRAIFGAELFARPPIRGWLRRLIRERKPFECVGTRDEARLALALALVRQPRPAGVDDADWTAFAALAADVDLPSLSADILERWDRPHGLPSELAGVVLACFARSLGP